MAANFEDVRQHLVELAARIGLGEEDLPSFGTPRGDGRPAVEVSGPVLSLVESERGHEYSRYSTEDPDEFAYAVLAQSITLNCALWLGQINIPYVDRRLLGFTRECHLFGCLDSRWRDRRRADLIQEIAIHPILVTLSETERGLFEGFRPVSRFADAYADSGQGDTGFSDAFVMAVLVERGLRDRGVSVEDAAEMAKWAHELLITQLTTRQPASSTAPKPVTATRAPRYARRRDR
jgi:hypothetical protein